jgi:hypothetical protein
MPVRTEPPIFRVRARQERAYGVRLRAMEFEPAEIEVSCVKGRTLLVRAQTNSHSKMALDVFYGPGKRRAVIELTRDNALEVAHAVEAIHDELLRRRAEWIATPEGQAWAASAQKPG